VEIAGARPERRAADPDAGPRARLSALLAAALSLYALYWVLFIVQPQIYRVSFLLIALVVIYLRPPIARGRRAAISQSRNSISMSRFRVPASRGGTAAVAWALAGATVAAFSWPLLDFTRFVYRAAEPGRIDLLLGTLAIGLVLEAARRTVGWVLPVTAAAFLVYGWAGPLFDRLGLPLLAHRGYGLERLVGSLYMTLEGIFGVPVDVTATYIILFTIYGAVLERTGAGTFFIQFAMSVSGRSRSAAARSVTFAGFLLGTVSGSGVATTVMLGSVTWPLLARAGYPAETAGAMLSAAGIGALLSPPTLGAAAFLIAEYLQISYLQVLVMATVPTVLYYLSILLMIEGDTPGGSQAKATTEAATGPGRPEGAGGHPVRAWRYWYHFVSLIAIGAFMVSGMSAFRAVVWATALAAALSYLRRETALTPARMFDALRSGGEDILGVAATTATAGIIVGVVTLTGLGLRIAGIIVTLAGGTLVLTVVYSAVAVWLLGLAVPVTASYIIAAVMVAPALVQAGVPDFAAHMFIFYYAVLSEVSPPTALSPFAAAALTGGNPFRTMLLTWKYTLPAFVVPLVFTLSPRGEAVLLSGPLLDLLIGVAAAAAGTCALAAGLAWRGTTGALPRRLLLAAAGSVVLFGPGPWAGGAAVVTAVVLLLHFRGYRLTRQPEAPR
jgi:TRAP transporter 4TM/12TM fusion protein